jgi:peroxiredoxin
MRADLSPGATFPDLELADHAANVRRLSELAGHDPLVLQFYRGWWCPKEQAFFRTRLVPFQEAVEVAYSRIVSVSVDPPEVAAAFRAGIGARWTFLCDPGRRYLDELELRETTDRTHEPYTPTVLTLYRDLRIRGIWNGYWYWGRPTTEELALDLREITREIRQAWEPPR